MSAQQPFLTIGQFARATQLSLKALRLYHQLGLLPPAHVDADSGYRYYAPDQRRTARMIRIMRGMDMPLATIRNVLTADPLQARQMVIRYRQTVEARIADLRRAEAVLLQMIAQQEQEMTYSVVVEKTKPQPIISIVKRVYVNDLDAHIRESLQTLFAYAEAEETAVAGPPFGLYHGTVTHEDNGPMEVCLPVQSALSNTEEIAASELSGGHVAVVDAYESDCHFPAILSVYDAAADWVMRNGYEISGPPREAWVSRPDEPLHMRIMFPFRER